MYDAFNTCFSLSLFRTKIKEESPRRKIPARQGTSGSKDEQRRGARLPKNKKSKKIDSHASAGVPLRDPGGAV